MLSYVQVMIELKIYNLNKWFFSLIKKWTFVLLLLLFLYKIVKRVDLVMGWDTKTQTFFLSEKYVIMKCFL